MVTAAKKQCVAEFVQNFKDYPIVGAVNMENLPTKQLQTMRETLRGKVVIKMAKRRLLKIAIDEAKKLIKGE